MLRLRSFALLSALGSAGVTTAVALVPRLHFAYRAPALHVAIETTAALTASAAAFLLLGRFRRTRFIDELTLAAGLSLLALSNLAFAGLPAIFDLEPSRALVWDTLLTGTVAALLICVAALAPRRRIGDGGRWPLVVYGILFALPVAGALPIVKYERLLPRGITTTLPAGSSQPHLVGHPAVLSLQLGMAVLYVLAALGFARRTRTAGDELSGWLAVACILAGAARVNYFLYPSLYSSWVYVGDLFRLGFYLALLVAAAREIGSYWTTAVAAVALEERRQLARDVHDGLAQEIAFIGRNVRLLDERGAQPELVARILGGVARAQEESKRVVGTLAMRLDPPLEEALEDAARQAAGRFGASVEMRLENGLKLSPLERDALIRIASEAVANAARHSGAQLVQLYLERRDGSTRLEVVDDGVGFEQETRGHGFGLVTMKDRAEALGGHLRVQSRRGAGTRVELEL